MKKPLMDWRESRNRSQAGQDIFVLTMLGWKRNGTYLEIGAAHPDLHNNTCLLSDEFGWTGLSVEIDRGYAPLWESRRPNDDIIFADVLTMPILPDPTGRIDYLQVDIDPATASLACLKRLPHDKMRFSVITFEHDFYLNDGEVRNESRQFLSGLGYVLAVPDVTVVYPFGSGQAVPYEDWWIDPQTVRLS